MLVIAFNALRDDLLSMALKANGWSITKKSAITQDSLGYFPTVNRKVITPTRTTESPVKPYTRLGEGLRSLSLRPILLKAW